MHRFADMHFAVYLPLAGSALLGLLAPLLGRWLPPATATRLLTAGGVMCADGIDPNVELSKVWDGRSKLG